MEYMKLEICMRVFTGLVLIFTAPYCAGFTDSQDGKCCCKYSKFCSVWFWGMHKGNLAGNYLKVASFIFNSFLFLLLFCFVLFCFPWYLPTAFVRVRIACCRYPLQHLRFLFPIYEKKLDFMYYLSHFFFFCLCYLVMAINSLYVSLGYPPLQGWLLVGGDPCVDLWQGVECVFSNITAM